VVIHFLPSQRISQGQRFAPPRHLTNALKNMQLTFKAQKGDRQHYQRGFRHLLLSLTFIPGFLLLLVAGLIARAADLLLLDTHHITLKAEPKTPKVDQTNSP
jgi:hypothetical protein